MRNGQFDLSGRVAIVTGGNGGIGLGMARGLADAGAAVAVVGRNEAKSAAAVEDLGKRGVKAIAVATDVTDKAAVAAMVERVIGELGRIDILVNNAGMSIRKPPHELELDEWSKVIDTNLTSAFLCSKAAYPALKASGHGKIINIGSMMSIFGASFAAAYAASKGALNTMTQSLARALAPLIRVNTVCPGYIDTPWFTKGRGEEGAKQVRDAVVARVPLKVASTAEDIANLVCFLASPASSNMTGEFVRMDAGMHLIQ